MTIPATLFLVQVLGHADRIVPSVLCAGNPVVRKARTPAQGIASLAATPSTFVLRESATTRTGERRRRVSGTFQFGQRDRGREAPHRGPRSGAPAARR